MSTPRRNIYLQTVSPQEALNSVQTALVREDLIQRVTIPSHKACGRVLAEAVYARHSSPTFHSAAMDGYAVNARATFSAREDAPLTLVCGRDAFAVNTGQPLPAGCDAVIMIEQVAVDKGDSASPEGVIRIENPAFPWQHVRRIGEDIVATELLFPRRHKIDPWDVGALLAGGIWEVSVWERIRVRIIPTGDEVLDFTTRPEPGPGQVVESNSQMLTALFEELGCQVERIAPVADDPQQLRAALAASLDAETHITVFCAGSSAGSKDFTRATIESEGEVLVHGIRVMPGKPSLLGLCRGRIVAGAPGYPVSALVAFETLLAPLVAWLGNSTVPPHAEVDVELTRSIPSRIGMEEVVRLAVGQVGDKYVGTPLGRGAGNITTVTRADAVFHIPAECEGMAEGSHCRAKLFGQGASAETLQQNLICVGSHDNTLDILADELMGSDQPFRLISTHVGSMGGITALNSGTCHFSGMHLFDPVQNDFNAPFLTRFAPELDIVLINLAIRDQGLMVQPGNPLKLQGLADLTRVRFINRQRGAGTRILLDWKLKQAQIAPKDISGYEKEESTHMAVAANVLVGAADCGMGICAASKALGLDFIPLAQERYDLAIPRAFLGEERICRLLETVSSPVFRRRVEALGGYDTRLAGQVMLPGMGLGH